MTKGSKKITKGSDAMTCVSLIKLLLPMITADALFSEVAS